MSQNSSAGLTVEQIREDFSQELSKVKDSKTFWGRYLRVVQ